MKIIFPVKTQWRLLIHHYILGNPQNSYLTIIQRLVRDLMQHRKETTVTNIADITETARVAANIEDAFNRELGYEQTSSGLVNVPLHIFYQWAVFLCCHIHQVLLSVLDMSYQTIQRNLSAFQTANLIFFRRNNVWKPQ